MPTLHPYIRVSTTEQETNYSEGAQRFSAENFLKNHLVNEEWVLGDSVREMGVSAFKVKIMKRKEFQKLTVKLNSGDGIYFAFVDRACRNLSDMVKLTEWAQKHQIRLFFGNIPLMTDPIMGPVILWLMAIFAWIDSMLKSQRIKEVKAFQRSKGMATGPYPKPGFKRVGEKGARIDVLDKDEMKDIEWIAPQLEAGTISYRKAVVLLEERYCARFGIPFRNSAFQVTHRTKNGKGRWHWNVGRLAQALGLFQTKRDGASESLRL